MTVSQLIVELSQRGVRIEAADDKLRYSPQSSLTPELVEALRRHKQTILAVLQSPDVELAIAWQSALDHLEVSGELPGELVTACRRAAVQRAESPQYHATKRHSLSRDHPL